MGKGGAFGTVRLRRGAGGGERRRIAGVGNQNSAAEIDGWKTPFLAQRARVPFLKRIELWVLLAIIVAGLVFVFSSRHPDEGDAGAGVQTAAAEEKPLQIHRCIVTRDGSNAQLDIELRVKNTTPNALVLQSPAAKLLDGKGREIPGFFLPFEPQPEVAPGSTQDVQLRYWLAAPDVRGALKLEVNGASAEVKTARAFDLNAMKNGEKRTVTPESW